jgi:hypothetical protein
MARTEDRPATNRHVLVVNSPVMSCCGRSAPDCRCGRRPRPASNAGDTWAEVAAAFHGTGGDGPGRGDREALFSPETMADLAAFARPRPGDPGQMLADNAGGWDGEPPPLPTLSDYLGDSPIVNAAASADVYGGADTSDGLPLPTCNWAGWQAEEREARRRKLRRPAPVVDPAPVANAGADLYDEDTPLGLPSINWAAGGAVEYR